MAERIRHTGIVESVGQKEVLVRIVQTSACASCKVASHCNASESKVKTVRVGGQTDTSRWRVGDEVTVSASATVAFKALLLSFGVPFVLMVAVLATVVLLTANETLGGLVAMASLLPYYALLYAFRGKIAKGVAFSIEES